MSDSLKNRIAAVKASGLFSEAEYPLRSEAMRQRKDPVEHYLTEGEARGAPPSRRFDPAYYRRKHGIEGDSPLIHYLLFGRKQGFRPRAVVADYDFVGGRFRPGFRRIIVIVGEGVPDDDSMRGCRLVRRLQDSADVIALFLSGGPLPRTIERDAAAIVAPAGALASSWLREAGETDLLAASLVANGRPGAVISQSKAGHVLAPGFSRRFVPVVSMIAEGAPAATPDVVYAFSSAVVFPDDDVRNSSLLRCPALRSRRAEVIPFGEDGEGAVPALLRVVSEAEQEMNAIRLDHDALLSDATLLRRVSPAGDPTPEIKRQIRDNFVIRGLDTGLGPIFPSPKILQNLDERAVWRDIGSRRGNPAAHHLLRGAGGPAAMKQVITPSANLPGPGPRKVALHGHYYYTELAEELLSALSRHGRNVDLYLSVDTEEKRQHLAQMLVRHGRQAEIRVLPNRGRDVGPFLTGFRDLFDGRYDIIGHVHGKRSPQYQFGQGEAWRRTLLENVVGFKHPMMEAILSAFGQDDTIGLVFPAIDNFCLWDLNFPMSQELAGRMGLASDLSQPFFEYPAGMMFWCRPEALRPLIDLNLGWEDYPAEPMPIDGTICHAIERLLPFVCESQGLRYVTTRVPKRPR